MSPENGCIINSAIVIFELKDCSIQFNKRLYQLYGRAGFRNRFFTFKKSANSEKNWVMLTCKLKTFFIFCLRNQYCEDLQNNCWCWLEQLDGQT